MPLHFTYISGRIWLYGLPLSLPWAPEQSVLMTMPATHWRNVSKQKLQKSIPLDTSCDTNMLTCLNSVDWVEVVFFATKSSQRTQCECLWNFSCWVVCPYLRGKQLSPFVPNYWQGWKPLTISTRRLLATRPLTKSCKEPKALVTGSIPRSGPRVGREALHVVTFLLAGLNVALLCLLMLRDYIE